VREEEVIDAEAALPSTVNSPAPTVSATDVDDASEGSKMIIEMVKMRSVVLRLLCQKGCLQEAGIEELETGNDIVLLHHKGGDTKSLLSQSFLCFL
jgi:hypothetical protein